MAKYSSIEFCDGGFDYFKANVNSIVLLKAYSVGDNFATVNTTNNVASVTVTGAEFPVTGADGAARVMTTPAKSAVVASAGSGATPDLHVAYVDTVNSKVIAVTDETSDIEIISGDPYDIPSISYARPQPV